MAWFIACFLDDQTVSMVSEKWPKKNLKKCYFPKTKIASKIKKQTPVEKKSGEWGLHACRILMRGRKYSTFEAAKEAEKIAQNYSTMSSYENSYAAKQEARKHPKVYKDSSAAESDCDEAKKIAELEELDGESISSKKEYTYHRSDSLNGDGIANQSSEGEDDQSCDGDDVGDYGSGAEDVDNNATSEENNDPIESTDEENSEADGNFDGENDSVNEHSGANENLDENDENVRSNDTSEKSVLLVQLPQTNLESTSEVRSPAGDYDFSEDRRLVRVEKLLIHACQELESIQLEMKALKIKSNETAQVVEKLVLVCKDLSVEVFACTEELKKRNGMFTDLLVPDLKLTVKRRKDYKSNEMALANFKVTDNMIKYLASTVNEKKETSFIAGCFNAIFDIDFLTKKVWWKSERGKVLIKKSQILHCMKESFKLKFGLVEPQKTDKEIVVLIHKTCRNIKDNYRKGLKKAREAAEKAEKDYAEAVEKATKKAAKKAARETVKETATDVAKETTKEAVKEAASKNVKEAKRNKLAADAKKVVLAEAGWEIEDYANYKKHKKAKKAAKKSKMICQQSDRDNHTVGNPEVKRGKKRLAKGDVENDAKKQKKIL